MFDDFDEGKALFVLLIVLFGALIFTIGGAVGESTGHCKVQLETVIQAKSPTLHSNIYFFEKDGEAAILVVEESLDCQSLLVESAGRRTKLKLKGYYGWKEFERCFFATSIKK